MLRCLSLSALALSLGFCMFAAAKRGVADVYTRQVNAYFQAWEKARRPVQDSEWRTALALADAAQRLAPQNPNVLEALARLYIWAAISKPPRDQHARADYEQALTYFRAAARRRPVSGYTWADIAQTKVKLAPPDREFEGALQHAAFLGPWEPEVQFGITRAGLAAWSQLDGSSREITREAAARGLKRHAEETLTIAYYRGRLAVLCEVAAQQRVAHPVCR